jgi:hypothetical protein
MSLQRRWSGGECRCGRGSAGGYRRVGEVSGAEAAEFDGQLLWLDNLFWRWDVET